MPKTNIAPKKERPHVKRAKKALEPKIIENTKATICIRGKKTSDVVGTLLKDLYRVKKPNSKMLSKRNDLNPFEDETGVEFLMSKNHASLFVFGSHNKKRPNNIVMGRTFDGHIMDMIEMGVSSYKGVDEFRGLAKAVGSKPVMLFEGELWDTDEKYGKLRNLFIDFFRADVVNRIALAGLDHAIVVTAVAPPGGTGEGMVLLRNYRISFKKVTGSHTPSVMLQPMGPAADLKIRRTKLCAPDLWKVATKKPKQLVKKKVKNITTNEFGDTLGRIHLGRQDLETMQVRRVKALRKPSNTAPNKRKRGDDEPAPVDADDE